MKLENYFEQFAQANNAVYWNSADRQTTLIGFGVSSIMQTDDLVALKEWQVNQVVPVFGGFSFDHQIPSNQVSLLNGFIAPEVVVDLNSELVMGDESVLNENIKEIVVQPIARIILDTDADDNWVNRVSKVIDEMIGDESKQKTVLGAQTVIHLSQPLDEVRLLKQLTLRQKTSYHVAFKREGTLFISATPERLVSVKQGEFATAAVAGSTPRGENAEADKLLGEALINDDKNRHEHALVVDEIVERVADLADVKWSEVPELLRTPQIQHLYTPITGVLHDDRHILDVVTALHPTPALGGVPREWAMNTIIKIERAARGLFAAPIGVIWPNGDGEFVIGIRAMIVSDKTVTLFAGAGILAASNVKQEWEEINLKMSPMGDLVKEQLDD